MCRQPIWNLCIWYVIAETEDDKMQFTQLWIVRLTNTTNHYGTRCFHWTWYMIRHIIYSVPQISENVLEHIFGMCSKAISLNNFQKQSDTVWVLIFIWTRKLQYMIVLTIRRRQRDYNADLTTLMHPSTVSMQIADVEKLNTKAGMIGILTLIHHRLLSCFCKSVFSSLSRFPLMALPI